MNVTDRGYSRFDSAREAANAGYHFGVHVATTQEGVQTGWHYFYARASAVNFAERYNGILCPL